MILQVAKLALSAELQGWIANIRLTGWIFSEITDNEEREDLQMNQDTLHTGMQ